MANIYDINSLSYTARENPEWFTRAVFGGRLIQGGYIRVLTGIKGEELLSQIDLANKILQADGLDCAWTPNQIMKLSEKKAKVSTYKINMEQCIDELEQKRTVYSLSPGAANEALPAELESATLLMIAIGLSNEIEEMIIGGDSAVDPNQFDGMQKLLLSSTESIKMVGATLTKANILGLIEDGYNAIPEDVLQAEDAGTLYVLCSYAARRLVRAALAEKSNTVIAASWTVDDADKKNPKLYYLGVELVPVKGIGKNTLIFYDSTNAIFLTDILSDLEQIELGSFPKPNEDKIFIKGRLRLGFVIPFEDEIVIIDPSITVASGGHVEGDGLVVVPNSLVFTAAGETKTFKIYTAAGVTPDINAASAVGFTATKGTTTNGVTTVSVVATAAGGNINARTGQVVVSLPDADRQLTVTLNQRTEDVPAVIA